MANLRKYNGRILYLPAAHGAGGGGGMGAGVGEGSVEASVGETGEEGGYRGPVIQPPIPTSGLGGDSGVGGGWEEISGELILFWLQNVRWCATDMMSHPKANV